MLGMLDDTLPHVVPLKGGSNFRDLGGYRTIEGRTVRRHAVFRSAHLGTLTDEDRAALGKLGVRTIVDLRGVSEAAETPHLIDGVTCRVVGAHIEPQLGDKIRDAVAGGTATPHLMMQFLTDHYRDYPRRCAPGFRTLFATLSDGTHRPLVFHCTAGKDRTGFASALLLTLLGVPWDTVMDDYLRTNELWTGHIGRYLELDIDTRAAIVEARTPYLEAAFDVVAKDFGGPEIFAEKALGLDAKARERLKADLLEG
jgi:protein-tyrosine phosphatase